MKIAIIRLAAVLAVAASLGSAAAAQDAEMPEYPLERPRPASWSFAGPFGKYDPQQLQRGFQIYKDVCSSCHSLGLVTFRTLASESGPRFSEEEVKALAAEYMIADPTVDAGERPGLPSDAFPPAPPYSGAGASPPDLSLVTKARAISRGFPTFIFDIFTQYQETGPDYVYSLLTGYQEAPAGEEVPEGLYYNPYFISASNVAMPPPLSDGQIDYAQNEDESPANDVPETVDQYAKDVTSFLMWAAEPHLVDRKAMGLTVMVFLVIFASLVYYTKKKVWAAVAH